MARLELAGRRFGRWQALRRDASDASRASMWRCICDCGTERPVRAKSLESGASRSCGCARREALDRAHTSHGLVRHPLYSRWRSMLDRTGSPERSEYRNYGGRGISVCSRWLDFANFYADMSVGFRPELELDRIDVNGNYEPGNCRWATRRQQQLNRRNNHRVTWRGCTMTAQEWAEMLGIKPNTLIYRLRRGWSIDRALTKDVAADRLLFVAAGGEP